MVEDEPNTGTSRGSSLQQGDLSLPDALRQAVLWHREGQVHAAAEIYRRILEQVPDHPEALHFQGVALHQLGRSEEGIVSIRRAVALGMVKINVASELCKAFRDTYAEQHSNGKTGWLPTVLGAAKPAMAKVVERWITLSGAAGKAR